MTKKKKKISAFDRANSCFMVAMMLVMLFPFWYCVAGSFNDGSDYLKGGVYLWPRIFTTANYQAVFRDKTIFIQWLFLWQRPCWEALAAFL